VGITAFIALIGLSAVYSATYTQTGPSPLFYKQLLWIAVGFVVMFMTLLPDYRTIGRYAYVAYGVSLLLLVLVMFLGRKGMGAQRWLALGPLSFQPSEVAKISLTLALARYFGDRQKGSYALPELVVPGIMILVPVLMVLKQPDLGTAMMLGLTSTIIVFLAGIRLRSVVIIALVAASLLATVAFVPPVKNTVWGSLKPYQQARIKSFIDPGADPLGTGYHSNQSKIAVGSGKIAGKGFRQGTQSQMAFLPERHTDFIFAVIAEERGLLGSVFLLVLYLLLLINGVDAAKNAKDRLGALMAAGMTAMLSMYVFINIGMAVGIMPVVGVPLPLVSYGGTSIIATFLALGLILNIQMRRFSLFY
jgi:rod shape determining protein RodA